MSTIIYKTWKKATYFGGDFALRACETMMAHPIEFPCVFVAFGKGIKSGNWQSCTAINTPAYVIEYYFDNIGNNKHDAMYKMWSLCKKLSCIKWSDVQEKPEMVKNLIQSANKELNKLEEL